MSTATDFCPVGGFGHIFDGALLRCPEQEAIVYQDWRITYRQLESLVNRTAHFLESLGFQKGDCIAIITRNCPEFLILEFAMYRLGVVPVKVNWRLTPREMVYLLEFNDVKYAFYRPEREDWAEQLIGCFGDRLPFFRLDQAELKNTVASFSDERVLRDIADDDIACHVHTSGTTGKPKTVVYTHGNMIGELAASKDLYGYVPGQRLQFIAQLFHSAAIGAHLSLCTDGTIILKNSFNAADYMQSLEAERVTAISVVPTVLKWVLDEMDKKHYDLSSINVVRYSTCPIPPALLERAINALHCSFFQSYGMTEMGSIVTTLQPEDHFIDGGRHLTTVGKPLPGAAVMIADENGKPCKMGETGEILVKGPGRMKEYLHKEELTAEKMKDGWYHTGDMGFLDEYDYLTIAGRADDMIISGGENIYPSEIVNVIMQLNDDIAECAVYGVPDEVWGEHAKASIVLVPGSRITADEIKQYCRNNMPHFRVPKDIEILASLPKNAAGKVLIHELKERSAQPAKS